MVGLKPHVERVHTVIGVVSPKGPGSFAPSGGRVPVVRQVEPMVGWGPVVVPYFAMVVVADYVRSSAQNAYLLVKTKVELSGNSVGSTCCKNPYGANIGPWREGVV